MTQDVYVSEAEFRVHLWEPHSAFVIEYISPGDHVILLKTDDESVTVITKSGRRGEILRGHFELFRKIA
jgi:hypothetical protein